MTTVGTGKLLVRLVVGGIFVGHGLQKLRGAFGGPGLEGTEKMVASMGMQPAPLQARAVALTETLGGAAIAAGAATPLAAAGLIATMVTAIRKVHWKNGLWNSNGGFEFNAVLISVVTGLSIEGPGRVSVDAAFGKHRWGILGGLFAVGAGVAGSIAAVEFGRRAAEAQGPAAAEPADTDPASAATAADNPE
ncbi:DoxX family protein [Leifsonia poae]|uniref:DoxX family protein n=1 Tax=Leifsonia poae TaxID=110933 RepID=UPI003D676CAB